MTSQRKTNPNSGPGSRAQQTWHPYEHDDSGYKCKLTCFSRESREYYQTSENVIDGTRCSYDRPNDICIQGNCIPLGCDQVSLDLTFQ